MSLVTFAPGAIRSVLKMHSGRTIDAFHWPRFSLGLLRLASMWPPANCTAASPPLLNGM
jgi:hypothetical protein